MAPRLASPLLAVLLVTSSSRGSTLSFRYPRRPMLEKRYSKVRYLVAANEQEGVSGGAELDAEGLVEDEMAEEYDAGSTLSEDLEDSLSSGSNSSEEGETGGDIDDESSETDGVTSSRRDDPEVASSAGGTAATHEAATSTAAAEHARRRQRAYQQYLGYDCDILASLLAPKRELCHQKFELVIDDLAFVGHPVCVDKEGRWDPEADSDRRGRNTARKAEVSGYDIGSPAEKAAMPQSSSSGRPQSNSTPMTLFHFVLVLDRPDPSPDLPALDLTSWLQIFYDNIAFKMTAALFTEEVRCGYVSRECEKISQLRERCMDDGQSYSNFLTHAIHVSSLARSLHQVHSSISLSSNAFVTINESIDAHLQLPPMLHDPARMMKMADVETPVDVNDAIFTGKNNAGLQPIDADQVMYEEWNRTTGPFLLPWKTLLLLHNHDDGEHREGSQDSSDIVGPGDKGIEEWARRFTSLLKPTLDGIPTLADVADLLGWDLEEDVFPMVRHLIYYREARVIDVPRIQNYYAVSPLFDLADLAKLSTSWSIRFATLPPLPSFLATLSSGLKPFSVQLNRRDQRQLCLDALIWLLRHEVIVQMHVRLRLIANETSKRRAAQARDQERERIKQKRIQIAARRARAQSMAEALVTETSSTHDEYSRSAPAFSHTSDTGETCERGRVRDRSRSPDDTSPTHTVLPSALSVTRPTITNTSPSPALSGLAMTPTAGHGHQRTGSNDLSVAAYVGELRFERRPVLRSRSPSRVLALTAGGTASSIGTRGSGSRPSTPRGRGQMWTHSRESSNVAVDVAQPGAQMTRSDSRGKTTQQQAQVTQPSSVPSAPVTVSTQVHGMRNNRRSRSPSRARLRVTGFGEDEEVYMEEQQEHAGDRDKSALGNTGPEDRMAKLMGDDMRRLSLVGEEQETELNGVEATNMSAAKGQGIDVHDTNAPLSDNGDDEADSDVDDEDEEMYLHYDIEIEPWETQPMASIITEPSRATGDENEWIAAMVEGRETWLVERLYS